MSTLNFEEELSKLNHEQAQAVNQIYGPIMVIAGPGTGKTQILSMRIGNILKQTDAETHNILCLTYTEAGTVAMRKRLTSLIGPDSYNIQISTFHGFCNKIIMENPELFSEHNDLRAVDDLERMDFFVDMVDRWPSEHILKNLKGESYYIIPNLKNLFSTMKSEGWSAEEIIQAADEHIASLPFNEDFQYKKKYKEFVKGDLKQGKIDEVTKKMEKLKVGAQAFNEFEDIMAKNGRFDYADMILWVRNALRKNEDLCYNLREQYQFILVDEYQDTNGAQNDILYLLCGEPESQPNIFSVGDDDQAIYRFQGANLSNIEEFIRRFHQDLFHVVLTDNYRSSQAILNASDHVIDHNLERLTNAEQLIAIDKRLQAAGDKNKTYDTGVLLAEFETETEEQVGVVAYIDGLIKKGVDPNEIAVLFRQWKNVAPLIKYFNAEGIAHQVSKEINVLAEPFVHKLINVLRYIQEEVSDPVGGAYRLYQILHYPWFKIPAIDLAKISFSKRNEKEKAWRLWVADQEALFGLKLQDANSVMESGALIESWISSAINKTIQALFEEIIYSKPIFDAISQSGQSLHYLQLANTFFNFIKDQTDKHEQLTLASFLNTLDRMEKNDIRLSMTRVDKVGEGIKLTTAHGSKGLEFEYVVVLGVTSSKWEKARGPQNKFSYPPNLVIQNQENKVEDERRLFYVCLTRAKKEALVAFSNTNLLGKAEQPSQFVEEIRAGGEYNLWKYEATVEEKTKFLFSQYAPLQTVVDQMPAQIDDILESLTLNISGVNKYLKCPLTFYYENILRAPLARTGPMGYGNAIHEALERIFRHEENKAGTFPKLELLLFYFEKGMERFHAHFTPTEYENYLANGKIKLTAYYNYHVDEWKSLENSITEQQVRNMHIDGIPVTGIFDRVDIIDDQLHIVDYKTGSATTGKTRIKPPASNIDDLLVSLANQHDAEKKAELRSKINGGDYWRQLVFYKLLVGADQRSKPFHSTYISYIESDEKPELYKKVMHVTPNDEELVKNQIKTVYDRIKNKEFKDGCNRANCKWCQLFAENKI